MLKLLFLSNNPNQTLCAIHSNTAVSHAVKLLAHRPANKLQEIPFERRSLFVQYITSFSAYLVNV
jgi:hypothetical protein